MTSSQKKAESSVLAVNRKARRDFHVLDRLEAGVELRGTEVKAIRTGQANLTGSHVRIEEGEAVAVGINVPAYEHGNRFNHPPDRHRRLLLHHKEIVRLAALVEQQGHTLVPLSLYLKRGRVKVEVGVCRGKTHGDKRETLRRRTADREAQRAMAQRR